MARKRMFDGEIINQDNFLDLSMEAKALYFLLGMEADDEGFVSPKKVMRLHGGTVDSLKNLAERQLIIPFKTGVVVITDWKRNNYLDKNRIKETIYLEEKKQLIFNKNSEKYELLTSPYNSSVKPMFNECLTRIEEKSIEESSIEENRIDINTKKETTTNIYTFVEENFGRLLTSTEVQKIHKWLSSFDEEVIKYAFEKSVLAGVRTFRYVEGTLNNWQGCNYKTIQDVKDSELKRNRGNQLKGEGGAFELC